MFSQKPTAQSPDGGRPRAGSWPVSGNSRAYRVWHAGRVPQVDVLQEMFVAARPALVAARLTRPDVPGVLWPDLTVTVRQDRGVRGQRFVVSGEWCGSAELWLPTCADGVLVHAYLRIDPAGGAAVRPGRAAAEKRRRDRWLRRALWVLKDELEAGRAPGTPVPATAG